MQLRLERGQDSGSEDAERGVAAAELARDHRCDTQVGQVAAVVEERDGLAGRRRDQRDRAVRPLGVAARDLEREAAAAAPVARLDVDLAAASMRDRGASASAPIASTWRQRYVLQAAAPRCQPDGTYRRGSSRCDIVTSMARVFLSHASPDKPAVRRIA